MQKQFEKKNRDKILFEWPVSSFFGRSTDKFTRPLTDQLQSLVAIMDSYLGR